MKNIGHYPPTDATVPCPNPSSWVYDKVEEGPQYNGRALSPASLPFLSSLDSRTPPGIPSTSGARSLAKPAQDRFHSHVRTVAILNRKREVYCCPGCALSEHQQSGKQVQVIELTHYPSDDPVNPESGFVDRNSDVNPCLQHHPAVGENNPLLEAHVDRCSPSVLAFQDQKSAAAFASEHGEQVVRFSAFAAEFQRQDLMP